mgnify:CR=1 FL=1
MDNPLKAFAAKYLKRPDCWKALVITAGVMLFDKLYLDRYVNHQIFGPDGKGGEALLCRTRVDHHEEEYREARKQFYWHQRKGKFYIPQDHSFNDKLDYKTLTYNYSHFNSYLNPKDLPKHHDPDAYYFNEMDPEDFYK